MRIAKNVYAVLDMFHPIYGVNAGFIVTKEHIVYVDAGWTIPSAQTILAYSLVVAPPANKPEYLILTDNHPDHISGMKTFKEIGVKTIGHANLDLWLRENKTEGLKEFISSLYNRWFKDPWTKEELNVIFGDIELSLLDQSVDKDKKIKVDDEEIHILCTPGHEKSCVSVYLPSSRILFAGDTVWGPRLDPAVRFGDKSLWRQWINSLEKLSKLDIDCIVPGHGRLCDTKEIPRHIKYLEKWIAEA